MSYQTDPYWAATLVSIRQERAKRLNERIVLDNELRKVGLDERRQAMRFARHRHYPAVVADWTVAISSAVWAVGSLAVAGMVIAGALPAHLTALAPMAVPGLGATLALVIRQRAAGAFRHASQAHSV